MTEEEAREKWCPMVRVRYDGDAVAVNMQRKDWAAGEKRPKCIASDCMMWREKLTNDPQSKGVGLPDYKVGYCGLGGEI